MTHRIAEFPLAGKVCRTDYQDMVVERDFRTSGKLTITIVKGPMKGYTATVDITVIPIRDDIFAIALRDAGGCTVQVEDVPAATVNTFMFLDGQEAPQHLQGTVTIM